MFINTDQITEIAYILIGDRLNEPSAFVSPDEFDNSAISFIRRCPIDVRQIDSPLGYISDKMNTLLCSSKHFRFVYSKNAVNFIKSNSNPNKIHLFIYTTFTTDISNFLKHLENVNNPIWYFVNLGDKPYKGNLQKQEIQSPNHFIMEIIKNQSEISQRLGVTDLNFAPSVPIEFNFFNFENYFALGQLNIRILSELFGNYGYSDQLANEEFKKVREEIALEATRKQDTFDRLHSVLDIIELNDRFFFNLVKQKIRHCGSGHDPVLPPLILVAPFHSPEFSNLRKSAITEFRTSEHVNILSMISAEQTNNYIVTCEPKDVKHIGVAAMFLKRKSAYLDDVAYLHSTFTQSPVIRLPLRGRSLNRELSFFRTKNHIQFSNIIYRRKIHRVISKLGNIMSESLLSARMKSYLCERNRQIVLISDLPLEWARINDIPLGFSHEVCRIPETSHATIMAQFMSNSFLSFEIGEDIIEKTLIISGSNEKSFEKWQKVGKDIYAEYKCQFENCVTVDEVCKAINKYKPLFVIFDCHGGVDEDKGETYLVIGDEKLTSEKIVSNNISVPLVFLSACGTAPSYGLYNSVANAFFQMGTFSVTATYLPVLVDSGGMLYLRVLNLLKEASEKGVHSNWLAFISHVIRTSSIHEAFKGTPNGQNAEHIGEILTRSMFFSERQKLYHELDDIVKADSKEVKNKFSQGVPEYLFYTNLGRSDLIYFSSWKKKVLT